MSTTTDRTSTPTVARTQVPRTRQAPATSPPVRRRQRRKWLDRLGWYELVGVASASTTRQVAGLFLGTSASPTSPAGVFIGKEQFTGWPFFHDVFQAYRDKVISSPNVLVVGDIGAGKSSFIKTWAVLRQLTLGRRVVVIDKKRQQVGTSVGGAPIAAGEYTPLARALGVAPIRFVLGTGSAGCRINVLDPAIAGTKDTGGASQLLLLRAVLGEALGREVRPMEGKALRVAHKAAVSTARQQGRVATIVDVVAHLDDPTPTSLEFVPSRVSLQMLAEWGQEAAAELERMISEDLAGLIDGPTSPEVSLTGGLTVFDISALPDDGPAVPIVMAIVNSWLRAVLDNQHSTVPTVFVAEEGWHLVDGTFAKVTRRNQKIARGEALMNVTALQHVSDVPAGSPAIATIQESETVVLFRQGKEEDAARCVEWFNLPRSCKDTLLDLPQGTALVKIGTKKPVIVTHVRSAWETAITDTDEAMHSVATVALHAQGQGS
ncbi:ATP/GTP-binding protein [Actinotalea sp. K2]|uniref:ATP/GTP-binding protein n=1 Tax=Actinotalea sp. K2 TaxID=2939438 RepID=UPI0020170223|nr:ATP/GTP-binding protein [Actinotalea sp. K2]MCL3863030.1 ATP/GTP-binding protein [Actinotalea sp. K2]